MASTTRASWHTWDVYSRLVSTLDRVARHSWVSARVFERLATDVTYAAHPEAQLLAQQAGARQRLRFVRIERALRVVGASPPLPAPLGSLLVLRGWSAALLLCPRPWMLAWLDHRECICSQALLDAYLAWKAAGAPRPHTAEKSTKLHKQHWSEHTPDQCASENGG